MSKTNQLNVDVGTLYPKGSLFLLSSIGEATLTTEYGDMSFTLGLANGKTPTVLCHQTGLYYTLSWDEILTIALESGITVGGVQ